ncbi:MAG: response regulator with CheY-like receiver domain and winged-helix DNA-binding domain [Pedosphaera sp.]|nr:response regulator with CheY-like receiver domain and winged-helix DNA-binding domain [Pedosphaera sp.]
MAEVTNQKYSILIVDDSEEDSFFLERALRQSTRFQVVGAVRDGEEAISYLSGLDQYQDRQLWPIPDVLLMDLKMPRLNGFEVLEWLQKQSFPGLKVVILSGSSMAGDIQRVKALGADAFYTKSAPNSKLVEMVGNLEQFLINSGPNSEMPIPSPKPE